MQTKKRAKPVKFGNAAKELETKGEQEAVVAPVEEPEAEVSHTQPEAASSAHVTPVETSPPAVPHGGELVDKLSDVPFETDFGTPDEAASPPHQAAGSALSVPEPVPFTATSTNPVEASPIAEDLPNDVSQPLSAPIDVNPVGTVPPIGRSNEPIPFNPHETVFNTPPEASEKKKNPFLYFLIIAFVAFVTGIAFMAGIYYAMPDKNFFTMPSIPALPGATEPTVAPSSVATASPTPVPSVKIADYKVSVLNGSGIRGEAAKAKTALETAGFTVSTVGNADRSDVTKTQIVYKKAVSKDALTKLKAELQKTYALEKETELPTSATQANDIVITIGKDAAK